jgi:hypothetical protein
VSAALDMSAALDHDTPVQEHAAVRTYVSAALDVSDAPDHAAFDEGCTCPRGCRVRPRRADAPIEQHAVARVRVDTALNASAALDHIEPIHPSSNTPLLVPTWAPRST